MKIGIISDIHEDIVSLNKAFDILEKNKCDEILCLGDIVGYDKVYSIRIKEPNASECVEAVRKNCKYALIGNHDLNSIRKLPEKFKGFDYPENWYELDLQERIKSGEGKVWLYENETPSPTLKDKDIEYLSSLPEYITLKYSGKNVLFSHSIFPDLTGSLVFRPYNPWDMKEHLGLCRFHKCQFSFSGHMHPYGMIRANINHFKSLSFRNYKLKEMNSHYFCPCIANNAGKSGLAVIDFKGMTISVIKLNKNNNFSALYEWLQP